MRIHTLREAVSVLAEVKAKLSVRGASVLRQREPLADQLSEVQKFLDLHQDDVNELLRALPELPVRASTAIRLRSVGR